jgi:hypothetical protein
MRMSIHGVTRRKKAGPRTARLDQGGLDVERRDVLSGGLEEAFDGPLSRVVERQTWEGGLAPHAGELENAPPALGAQVRQRGAHDLDRADQVGVDLVDDLFIGEFLDGTEEAVARTVNNHVDPAEAGKCRIDDAVDGGRVSQVKRGEPKPPLMPVMNQVRCDIGFILLVESALRQLRQQA